MKSGESRDIHVLEEVPFHCKIAVADHKPPLVVNLTYKNIDKEVEVLEICGSFSVKEPAK